MKKSICLLLGALLFSVILFLITTLSLPFQSAIITYSSIILLTPVIGFLNKQNLYRLIIANLLFFLFTLFFYFQNRALFPLIFPTTAILSVLGSGIGYFIVNQKPLKLKLIPLTIWLATMFTGIFVLVPNWVFQLKISDTSMEVNQVDFNLNNKENSFKASDFKDKIVVLDFWATFCEPCILSLKHLNELSLEYADNNKVIFLAVNPGDYDKLGDIILFEKRNPMNFPAVIDEEQQLSKFLNFDGIPQLYILKNNKIIFHHQGYSIDEKSIFIHQLRTKINQLLKL